MRELLGSPKSCFAATRNKDDSKPFITALLEYEGYTCVYETGIDNVRVFDASIEVMGDGKRLRLDYDTVRSCFSLSSVSSVPGLTGIGGSDRSLTSRDYRSRSMFENRLLMDITSRRRFDQLTKMPTLSN